MPHAHQLTPANHRCPSKRLCRELRHSGRLLAAALLIEKDLLNRASQPLPRDPAATYGVIPAETVPVMHHP